MNYGRVRLYYTVIKDYFGNIVEKLPLVGTHKHAAYQGQQFVDTVPPAGSWQIIPVDYTKHELATVINRSSSSILLNT